LKNIFITWQTNAVKKYQDQKTFGSPPYNDHTRGGHPVGDRLDVQAMQKIAEDKKKAAMIGAGAKVLTTLLGEGLGQLGNNNDGGFGFGR